MNSLVRKLNKFLRTAEVALEYGATTILAIMLVLNGVNILVRTVFGYSILWVWPWTMVLFVWMILISFFLIYRKKKDISVFVVVRILPEKAHLVVGIFVYTIILLVVGVILLSANKVMEMQAGVVEIIGIPRNWVSIPLFVSAFLIAIDAILNIVNLTMPGGKYRAFGEPVDQE